MEAISIDDINQLKEENAKLRSELILVSNQYNKVVEQNKELQRVINGNVHYKRDYFKGK